jgi:Arc/MetJ-type ribon-helix-helix transcriptional regulator
MHLVLDPAVQKQIEDRVKSGKYASAEAVVVAALTSLDQIEQLGEFESGELETLLAEGERSIEVDGTLDGEEAFELRRQRRRQAGDQGP